MAGRKAIYLLPAALAFVLLLAGLVAAEAIPEERGLGIMSRALATSDTECAFELAECNADTSCVACLDEYVIKRETCDDGEGTCDDAQAFFCCTIADEDENCENDTAFSNYIECGVEALSPDCGANFVDLSDCNGARGLSRVASNVLRFTAVVGLLPVAFAFTV